MNFQEALKKLDEIAAGDVTPEEVQQLSAELELSICYSRREFIAWCKHMGYTDGEIQDGLVRYDKSCDEMAAEALDRLQGKRQKWKGSTNGCTNATSLLDVAADSAIEVAIGSLISTYSSIKTSDQTTPNPTLDRVTALRVLVKRLLKKNVTNAHRKREANVAGTSQ